MKKYISVILSAMLFAAALAGCNPNENKGAIAPDETGNKINVVATIFPQYDFARAIAGDKANIIMLVNPGAEIHSFDPSPSDIIKIQNSDMFIYTGGESDVWVDTILESMDTSDKKLIRLLDCVTPVEEETVEGMEEEHPEEGEEDHPEDEAHDHEEGEYDEHVWTSPKNAVLIINAIADALCEMDAENADTYRKNAASYVAQINELDAEIRGIIDNAKNKMLIFGDRFPFRYFADEYGLDYRAAFPGCSTETEASAGTIAYLIKTVGDNHIPYIFTIELSNQNIAKSISEQTGAGILQLQSCQNITRNDFEAGKTYLSLMKENVENLRKGLK